MSLMLTLRPPLVSVYITVLVHLVLVHSHLYIRIDIRLISKWFCSYGLMFSIVIMMLIQQYVLPSVRFDSTSTGHWFFHACISINVIFI